MLAAYSYEAAKVGDDLDLEYLYKISGVAVPLESAAITIKRTSGNKAYVVRATVAAVVDVTLARYRFTPAVGDEYLIEWHLVHSGGVDHSSQTISLQALPRL